MIKRVLTLGICVFALTLSTFASPAPDKAMMEKIWAGWCTLNPANVDQFYARGDHTFFDIAPLKYASWEEYKANVTNVLAGYTSATCSVNDDARLHNSGDLTWGTATVKYDMVQKSGKHDMGNFRWTVIWQKQHDGKWLIVHDHTSEPLQ